ncbi:hypothetical protein MRX96_049131 [Rhipicephalus microplus]
MSRPRYTDNKLSDGAFGKGKSCCVYANGVRWSGDDVAVRAAKLFPLYCFLRMLPVWPRCTAFSPSGLPWLVSALVAVSVRFVPLVLRYILLFSLFFPDATIFTLLLLLRANRCRNLRTSAGASIASPSLSATGAA